LEIKDGIKEAQKEGRKEKRMHAKDTGNI